MQMRSAILAAVASAVLLLVGCDEQPPVQTAPAETTRHFTELHPGQMLGLTGQPLGSLTSAVGTVKSVADGGFTLHTAIGQNESHLLRCVLWNGQTGDTLPGVGEKISITGYESLRQRGFDQSVGEYFSTRTTVLNAMRKEARDPPGGDGPVRFETVLCVIDFVPMRNKTPGR